MAAIARDGEKRGREGLLYAAAVYRKTYRARLRRGILALLASIGVWYTFTLPFVTERVSAATFFPEIMRALMLDLGRFVAAILIILSAVRVTWNLILTIRRRTERMKFYKRGFIWEKGGELNKYGWNAVKTVREDPYAIMFRNRPLIQWGGITFKMRDGNVYRFTGAHGNMLTFLQRVRPYYSAEIGARMGQMVRLNKSFRVHPGIMVTPGGVLINDKQRVEWKNLHINTEGKTLTLGRFDAQGALHKIISVPKNKVENLGGFVELVEATIENYQRPNPYAS